MKPPGIVTSELLDLELMEGNETANEKWMRYIDKYVVLSRNPSASPTFFHFSLPH